MSLHVAHPPEPAALPHVEDGDLLRFQDGELVPDHRARVAAHVDACAQCAGRRAALVAVAERLRRAHGTVALPPELATPPWHNEARGQSAVLAPPPLGKRTTSVALRVTAALVALAAAAAASTPIRGWLFGLSERPAPHAPIQQPAAVARTTTPTVALHTADVSFVPTSATLTIALRATAGDSVEVRAIGDEAVRIRGRATTGDPTVIVLPDRVELVSPRNGVSAYVVDVPPNVHVIEVRDSVHVVTRLDRETLDSRGAWRGRLP